MTKRIGFALALAFYMGAVSAQAEAANTQTSADASGKKASKKRQSKNTNSPAAVDKAEAENARSSSKADKSAKGKGTAADSKKSGKAAAESTAGAPQKQEGDSTGGAPSETASSAEADGAQNSSQQPPASTPTARPWAEGVSPENQKKALTLFREGNTLLKDSVFAQASQKYMEALSFWDHPAIHYNLVLALLNLDRPTQVLEHLEKAMAYGPDPIDPEKYEQARNYKMLTESQLTHLTVRCELEGAVVSMDGQELFVAPGKFEGYVRPGPHSIVAKKEGYMNNEVSPALVAGGKAEYDMVLLSAAEATEYKRRWAVWKPWSVFAGGIVIAGIGAVLHVKGRSAVSDYDDAVSNISLGTASEDNIVYASDLESDKNAGLRNQKIAMVMYGVGGAAIAAGSVLLYMNRSRPYNPTTGEYMDEKKDQESASESQPVSPPPQEKEKKVEVSVLPMISTESAGMMATIHF